MHHGAQGDAISNLFDQQITDKVLVETLTDIFGKTPCGKRIWITTEVVEIKAIRTSTGGKVRE